MANQSLINALESTLGQINRQILNATNEARQMEIRVEDLRTRDGEWVMNELLLAKAFTLNGLAALEAAKQVNVKPRK